MCVAKCVCVQLLSLCVFGFSSGKARTLPGRQGVSKINSVLSAGLSRGQFQAPTLLFTHYWPRLHTHTHTQRAAQPLTHRPTQDTAGRSVCSWPNTTDLTSSNQPDQPNLKINSTENKLCLSFPTAPPARAFTRSSSPCVHDVWGS